MTDQNTQTADGIANNHSTENTMTPKKDYTSKEPHYKWDLIISEDSLETYRLFLINLERYINSAPNSRETFYEIIEVFKENTRPAATSYHEFIGAIAYLVIYEKDPRIAPIDIVTAAGNEFSKADLMKTAGKIQYETELYNPLVYLERLRNIGGEEQEKVEKAIPELPTEILNEYEGHNEAIAGAAMYTVLDDSIEEICCDRFNGNLLPDTLESIVDRIDDRTFEEKWAEWAADLDGELRDEFHTVCLEDAKLAVAIEKNQGMNWFSDSIIDGDWLPFPVEQHIRALKEIDMLEGEDGTYRLARSCFVW